MEKKPENEFTDLDSVVPPGRPQVPEGRLKIPTRQFIGGRKIQLCQPRSLVNQINFQISEKAGG